MKRRSLLQKPLRGGTPAKARNETAIAKAVTGIRLPSPLKASMLPLPSLSITRPAPRNAAPFITEWLMMWKSAPVMPIGPAGRRLGSPARRRRSRTR